MANPRAHAARIAWRVIDQGQSLDNALQNCFADHPEAANDFGFIQELAYGIVRWYGELNEVSSSLLRSPIRRKDRVVHFVLLAGLYQLRHLQTAEHAAVSETVSACAQLNKAWAGKLINGCLRNYLRQPVQLQNALTELTHPAWLRQAIICAWPAESEAILAANNERPPMCLRVNRMQYKREEYLQSLNDQGLEAQADPYSNDGIILTRPVPVTSLPGFAEGAVSVQDSAAQLACDILPTEPGQRVLDACAAPGGKAAHLLERNSNQLSLQALDISAQRCEQLRGTMQRLHLTADIAVADASQAPCWQAPADGYHRIVIDAPCSGTGVIRRHPDIRYHRRPQDLQRLAETQQALLQNLWRLLMPGGVLLYMTCSILPAENEQQISAFLAARDDVEILSFEHPNARQLEFGQQTLPGVHNMDGFYYSLLYKRG